MSSISTKLSPGGRVVIPAEIRRRLGLKEGDTLLIREVDGEIRITTKKHEWQRAQALVRQYIPAGCHLVDELIADRRKEAAHE